MRIERPTIVPLDDISIPSSPLLSPFSPLRKEFRRTPLGELALLSLW